MSQALTVQTKQPMHSFAELERMAVAVAKSGLFGVKTPEAALTLMLIAQEEGTGVASAARDFHIIEGKPALKVDAMLARFQAAGGRVDWHELTDQKAEATFSHPSGGAIKLAWTWEMAVKAKLSEKDVWKKYARAMLRSRLVSEGIRTVSPGSIVGVYTPEELADDPELRDITPRGEKLAPESTRRAEEEPIDVDTSTGEIKTDEGAPAAAAAAEDQKKPAMDENALADHLAAIDATSTLTDLKNAHAKAYAAAHAASDGAALLRFEVAKNAQKYRITKGTDAK